MKQIQGKPLDEKRWLAIVEMRNTLETVAAMLKAAADNYDRATAPSDAELDAGYVPGERWWPKDLDDPDDEKLIPAGESWQIGDHEFSEEVE